MHQNLVPLHGENGQVSRFAESPLEVNKIIFIREMLQLLTEGDDLYIRHEGGGDQGGVGSGPLCT